MLTVVRFLGSEAQHEKYLANKQYDLSICHFPYFPATLKKSATMLSFNYRYFLCFIGLFITEVLIAAFVHDNFIRPTFGDFLVVLLMYCFLRSFIQTNYRTLAIVVGLIAYIVEITQYFHLIVLLGLHSSTAAQWILGTGFSWGDILAYTLGVIFIWIVESKRGKSLTGVGRQNG